MAENLRNTWKAIRLIPNDPFVQDDDWQDSQDIPGWQADSGAVIVIAKPDDLGRLELSMQLLESDGTLVPPRQNSRLRIQLIEGVSLGEVPVDISAAVQAQSVGIKAKPFLQNVGIEFDLEGEEGVSSDPNTRARLFVGLRAISVSGLPAETDQILVMARYS